MNPYISKLLKAVNKAMGVEDSTKKIGKLGHEPTPQKKIRAKGIVKHTRSTNNQKKLLERKAKKHRQMEAQSRKINRLRS